MTAVESVLGGSAVPQGERSDDVHQGFPTARTRGETATGNAVWRIRLVVGVLLLAAVSFRQAGGRVVPDTKLDLTANPGGFLSRALHMWDPLGAMGQLQNQAYGYLFPVGPFHWALTSVAVPDWVVQRLWWTVILATAFLGMWRLLGAMEIGSPWARYVAALAFALSPRFISEVAITSVEVWPLALSPWVLAPLVDRGNRSWAWRITGSAAAFFLVGGVNAVATAAVLVPPVVWFATRRPVAVAFRWFLVWLAAMTAVSVWWLIPLVLLGRFSPPFLDWIENASVTTAFASPFETMRGTTPWLNYLSGAAGPSWPAGWELVTSPMLIVLTAALALAGLLGISIAPRRHRSFLGVCVLVGVALVTLGHAGPGGSPVAGGVQTLLDGPLAALRNTHKFELVVRLPLTLGLAQALTFGARRLRSLRLAPWLAPVAAVSALLMLASPGITAGLARPESYTAIPQHWRDAAAWLDDRAAPGTTLVTPAAGFADFTWGSTKDDPLQALANRPFVVRDAVPLGSAGTTRWLDSVESRLQAGTGGVALRAALVSAGIRFVLVRNDLRPDAVDSGGGQNLRLHEALADTGLTRAATFGPVVSTPPGMEPETPEHTVDQRTRLPYPAIEVFDVGEVSEATVVPGDAILTVRGGAEDVPDAMAAIPGAAAAVVGSDIDALPERLGSRAVDVVTDGNQAREVFFGRASNNTSQVLAPEDPRRTGRTVTGFVADAAAPQTERAWPGGLAGVAASSSASDANASIRLGPGYGPDAAVDGDPATAWLSGRYGSSADEWIEVTFARPMSIASLGVTLERPPRRLSTPTEVRVDSDAGSETTRLAPLDASQKVRVASGPTTRVRITVTDVAEGGDANGVGISEVSIPGAVEPSRLEVPSSGGRNTTVVLRRTSDGRAACAWVGTRPLCTSGTSRQPEAEGGIRRTLHLTSEVSGAMSGTVVARPGAAVERLLEGLTSAEVAASSRAVTDPGGRPAAAMDADLGTGWVASPSDDQPSLTIALPRRVSTDRVQLQRDPYLAASAASQVAVSFDGGRPVLMQVDAEGYLRWSRRTFKNLGLQFMDRTPVRSTDSASGIGQVLPVGVSEVVIPGFNPVGPLGLTSTTGAPCGFGPDVIVNGQAHQTEVSGSVDELLGGKPLAWTSCGSAEVTLSAATAMVDAPKSAEFIPVSLVVGGSPSASDRPEPELPLVVDRPDPARLSVDVPSTSDDTLLVVHQNYSDGWVATGESGTRLTPIRVNGWQQGWILPAGSGQLVHAEFQPDAPYRWGMIGGALLAVGVLIGGFWMRRSRPVPPLGSWVPGRRRWSALVLASLTVISGPLGLVAGGLGVLATRVLSRHATYWFALGATTSAAALVVAGGTWPQSRQGVDSAVVQLLVLAALAACLAEAASVPDPDADARGLRSLRRPHRMTGRSTR
jgi:arabinofuranan 3-O-arabinosyltransferase